MRRIRLKTYLTTGAILGTELLATDAAVELSKVCRAMMDGNWYIFLVDGVKVCVNPAQVTHVAAEEIEE